MHENGLLWAKAEGDPLCKVTRQLTMEALISIQRFKNRSATKEAACKAFHEAYEMSRLAMANVRDQEDIDQVEHWITVLAGMREALHSNSIIMAYPRSLLDTLQETHADTFATLSLGPFATWTTEDINREAQGLEPLGPKELAAMRQGIREHERPLDADPRPSPGCSLSLSARLVDTLTTIFNHSIGNVDRSPPPNGLNNLVLSVGSGSGLLEAHLQSRWSSEPGCNKLRIHGVEVRDQSYTTPNRYLPFKLRSTVRGTWETSTRILPVARALMFVYPRSTTLIIKYLEAIHHNKRFPIQVVVWLGPKNDWEGVFRSSLENKPGFGPIEPVQDCGLPEYEMMAVIRRVNATT